MPPDPSFLRRVLETVYADCHRTGLIDPDPLLVVREYGRAEDREIAALFCASIALGRASTIVSSCRKALSPFGDRPSETIAALGFGGVLGALGGFKHRFFDAYDAASLLSGAVALAGRFGGLEAAFVAGSGVSAAYSGAGPSASLLSRCDSFVDALRASAEAAAGSSARPLSSPRLAGPRLAGNLLPAPRGGSACKRLMLFLRWMVRRDDVDPGGWTLVAPSELVLPLDVHLHRISRSLGLTSRSTADLRAALEATAALRAIDPDDPVRFDFSLARLGIRSDYSINDFYSA